MTGRPLPTARARRSSRCRSRSGSGMADLDLEGAVALLAGAPEERDKLVVGQVVVEPAGIGAHRSRRAPSSCQRHPLLLTGQIPERHLDPFVEG